MSNDPASVEGPPRKLPFSATRVIRAVPLALLGDFEKLLACEVFSLWNGPDGCYMGSGPMAQRLGCSRERVEVARRELMALGLMSTLKRPERRTASWYVLLPHDCTPRTAKPTDGEVLELAIALGRYLADRRTGKTPLDSTKQPPQWRTACTPVATESREPTGVQPDPDRRTGTPEPAYRLYAPEVGEGGSTLPPTSQRLEQPPTSPPPSEVGAAQEPEAEVGQQRALPRVHDQPSGAPRRNAVSIGDALKGSGWDMVKSELARNGCLPPRRDGARLERTVEPEEAA